MTTPLNVSPLELHNNDIDISQPLDENQPPDLISTYLSPVYSAPSLNLILDYYSQSQSTSNNLVIWNLKNLLVLNFLLISYIYYLIKDNYQIIGIKKSLLLNSNANLFHIAYFLLLILSTFLIFLKNYNNYFKNKSKKLALNNASELFININLNNLILLNEKTLSHKNLSDEDQLLLQNCQNVKLFIYRNVPIAIIILNPYTQVPDSDQFIVKIMGLNVRKVYKDIGLYDDLISWAIERSLTLTNLYNKDILKNKHSVNEIKLKKNLILNISVYSFCKVIKQSLLKKKFKLIKKNYLPTFLGSFYKISNDNYQLSVNLNEISSS
ncbi:Pho86p ASCRUDRAFT_136630 [Ascoidea rubescens DSM 1968]|uniref:Uncharacterized protein n=1 Tax=Ascoidea rubescens DSM 1968 TaxID=1344418 RepID=A0A1D2VLX4_9ASCO|nr:hypothetical protein ASCRUDRAFT_136630 [Ascoidea rubescens DSM 1968]ODV62620.1 hypothetical protein ASCRUDRAFT_136630 [Ascoidea rubescens DSM 1968]